MDAFERKPWHVYPTEDIREHEIEGAPCPCIPMIERFGEGALIITHQSFDGREWTWLDNPRLN